MKQFACGDVVPGCAAVFEEADTSRILAAVAAHAAKDHGISADDALVATVTGLVREAA